MLKTSSRYSSGRDRGSISGMSLFLGHVPAFTVKESSWRLSQEIVFSPGNYQVVLEELVVIGEDDTAVIRSSNDSVWSEMERKLGMVRWVR